MEIALQILGIIREIFAMYCLVVALISMHSSRFEHGDALNWLILAGLSHFWMGV